MGQIKNLIFSVLTICIITLTGCGEEQQPTDKQTTVQSEPTNEEINEPVSEPETITFSGETYSAEYRECSTNDFVSGCFYVTLHIKNTGDVEHVYSLDNVYVDDEHCFSGSGLPITALDGKSVTGTFIVFCETPLADIEKVEFSLKVMKNENFSDVETSESITVYPNS